RGTLLCCQGQGRQRAELAVEVAGEHPLDAAPRLARGLARGEQALVVGRRFAVVADTGERDHVQGAVQLAVAAPVQSVALLLPARSVDRARAGEGGEGGLACHARGITAGDDQLSGADRPDAAL